VGVAISPLATLAGGPVDCARADKHAIGTNRLRQMLAAHVYAATRGERPVEMLVSEMMRPTFWLAAMKIMGINILLSGDNAVVIALAVRALPPKERFWGMVLGAGCAAVLLILFTGIVATLL